MDIKRSRGCMVQHSFGGGRCIMSSRDRDYVSAMRDRFNSVIERIQNRQEQQSSSESLVERLRLFRENAASSRGPRRRVQTRLATFRVGLLLHPDMETFHPQKGEALRKVKVPVSLSAEEFHAVLRNAFPRVGSTDFELARVDCHKKVTRLQVSPLSPSVLKASRELNRSALYLLPKESLAEQVGEQQDGCNVNDAEEVLDSCQSLDQDDDALQAVQESHDPEMVEVADDVVEVADDVVEVADDVVEVADDFADDLHEWRALRARQDEEYLESLQTDQERGQAQRREVEVYRKRKEALERRRLNLSNRAEPQDGIPLQVKYPDGHVARRRFDLMQPIQRARASPIRSTTTGKIIDHINESCMVYVTWDDVIDTDIAHILVPEEDNSPQNSSSVPLDTTAGFPNLSHVNDPNE
ncbi:uncharacterized protein LOC114560584 isoform X2 [Perca flavescens]|uniref:uncharacterized protein LOC114560584 isoform X2 n=1 Tax=Perca flavescens TaxID=8167 RepID=UPI00106ECF08|nr:uncharacterized protein LOC114560584 isoform X2 [Perca flavescens]